MAEIDGTGTEQDHAGRAPVADPVPTAAVPIAQRNSLPMRRASTMPDVSRYAGGPAADAAADPEPAEDAPRTAPATAALPVTGPAGPESVEAESVDASAGSSRLDAPQADASHRAADTLSGASVVADSSPDAHTVGDHSPDAHTVGGHSPDARAVEDHSPDAHAVDAATGPAPRTAGLGVQGPDGGGSGPLPGGAHAAEPGDAPGRTADGTRHAGGGGATARREPGNEPDSDTGALLLRPSEQEVQRRALEREHAVAAKPMLARVLQVFVALIFPVVVLAGAVRAVTSSLFLWAEYHRPGFPADEFGFSTEDRMTYGSYAVDYVLNLAPARYLGGLVNPGGQQLFLDSEVSHMADVKSVLALGFLAGFVLFCLGVAACVYLSRRYKGGIRRALFSGAVLTLVLIAALAVVAVLAWDVFFTRVHGLFFADGTWTFRVDDTLIRLFPEQFWTDAAATVGVLVLAVTLLTLVLTWPSRRRREKSRAAQDALQARHRAALSAP